MLADDQFKLTGRHSTLNVINDDARHYLLWKLRLLGRKKNGSGLSLEQRAPDTKCGISSTMAFQLERHGVCLSAELELKSVGDASEIGTVERHDAVQSVSIEADTKLIKSPCIPLLETFPNCRDVGLPHRKVDQM